MTRLIAGCKIIPFGQTYASTAMRDITSWGAGAAITTTDDLTVLDYANNTQDFLPQVILDTWHFKYFSVVQEIDAVVNLQAHNPAGGQVITSGNVETVIASGAANITNIDAVDMFGYKPTVIGIDTTNGRLLGDTSIQMFVESSRIVTFSVSETSVSVLEQYTVGITPIPAQTINVRLLFLRIFELPNTGILITPTRVNLGGAIDTGNTYLFETGVAQLSVTPNLQIYSVVNQPTYLTPVCTIGAGAVAMALVFNNQVISQTMGSYGIFGFPWKSGLSVPVGTI